MLLLSTTVPWGTILDTSPFCSIIAVVFIDSGFQVSNTVGIVELNMSNMHWHVFSHVFWLNFGPLELTRFSKQFVPDLQAI